MGKNGLPSCGHDPAFVLWLPRLNNRQARGCPSPSPKGSPPALRSNGQLLSRKSLRQVNTIDSYRLQVTYKRRESSRPQIFPKFLPGRFAFSLWARVLRFREKERFREPKKLLVILCFAVNFYTDRYVSPKTQKQLDTRLRFTHPTFHTRRISPAALRIPRQTWA